MSFKTPEQRNKRKAKQRDNRKKGYACEDDKPACLKDYKPENLKYLMEHPKDIIY